MNNKKGQAAMEFLMTYGWAILVVLIAIGALAYFGVLNPGRFLPESCTLTPGLSCEGQVVRFGTTGVNDSTIQLTIRNGKGADLTNVGINITATDSGAVLCDLNCTNGCTGSYPDWTLADSVLTTWTATDCTAVGAEASKFKGDVKVAYTESGIPHVKTGSLTTQVE